jgi:hypothetical protein
MRRGRGVFLLPSILIFVAVSEGAEYKVKLPLGCAGKTGKV